MGKEVNCPLCQEVKTKSLNHLCPSCCTEINNDAQAYTKYNTALQVHKEKYIKYKKENLTKNDTPSCKKAFKYVFKVATKQLNMKVIREKIARPYMIDIYIPKYKIGIEIDGGIHDKQMSYDDDRDRFLLKNFGIAIYRFSNYDVGTDYFKDAIWHICVDAINKNISPKSYQLKLIKL